MASSRLTLLYDDAPAIGIREYEKLLQSLLWAADTVLLPPTARPALTLSPSSVGEMTTRLSELIDRDLVGVWTFDSSVRPFKETAQEWLRPTPSALRPLTPDAYGAVYSMLEAETRKYRSEILSGRGAPGNLRLEGISEFVSLQSALWSLGLADALNADQILLGPVRAAALDAHVFKAMAVAQATGPVTQALMDVTGAGPLSVLEIDEIIELRKNLAHVRQFLTEVVEKSIPTNRIANMTEVVTDAQTLALQEYVRLAGSRASSTRGALRTVAIDWTVNLLGLIHPLLQVASFAKPVVEWRLAARRDRGIVVFVAKLSQKTRSS